MKAVIISDSMNEAEPLVRSLNEININSIVLQDLDISALPDGPFLFYRDPYQRIQDPRFMLDYAIPFNGKGAP